MKEETEFKEEDRERVALSDIVAVDGVELDIEGLQELKEEEMILSEDVNNISTHFKVFVLFVLTEFFFM